MITVRIGGNEFPLEEVLEDPGRYARHLERAKTVQGFAECRCTESRPRPKRTPKGQSTKPQRRSARLLAFLEFAWEQAGLNVWPGTGARSWNACWSQLTVELADCRINGKAADGLLHIMQRWDPARKSEILAEFEAWQARLSPTAAGNRRGILIEMRVKPRRLGRGRIARTPQASLTTLED